MNKREALNRAEVGKLTTHTFAQRSIEKTRAMLSEANRLIGVMRRQILSQRADAETKLELLLDAIVAETGLELTRENMPTIMTYVTQYFEDLTATREKARERREVSPLLGEFADDERLLGLPGEKAFRMALERRQREIAARPSEDGKTRIENL